MGLSNKQIENLKYGSLLHDLGKLDIDINILGKNSGLDAEEREKIKLHPEYGATIIKDIEFLETAREIVLYHHEKFDGTGYPNKLKGDQIPLMARIVAIADAFDAMTSDRAYRKKLDDEKVFSIIAEQSGKQFDPRICELFLRLKPDILKIKAKMA
jgi:HD-GYP domain-containing protein (c-di-GMP phosphodiesterase class II)